MDVWGRFTNQYRWHELIALYEIGEPYLVPILNLRPRFNFAPTERGVVIRLDREKRREPAMMRWGLVPSWARDDRGAARLININAETAANKRPYRSAFLHRRCLVAADGFYGWKSISAYEKQPYFITLKERRPFAFAGLWQRWRVPKSPPEAPLLETFTILTTASNAVCKPFQGRMPAILTPEKWQEWLGETKTAPETLGELLKPFAEEHMESWPIDKLVWNPKNDGPELIARIV